MCDRFLIHLVWLQIALAVGFNQGTLASITIDKSANEDFNDSLVKMDKEPSLKSFIFDSLDKYGTTMRAVEAGVEDSVMREEEEPEVEGILFSPRNKDTPPRIIGIVPETDLPDSVGSNQHKPKEDDEDKHFIHLITLLACSFTGGILLTTAMGILIYLYKRKRWKNRNIVVEADLNSPKLNCGVSSYQDSDSTETSQSSSDTLMEREGADVENTNSPNPFPPLDIALGDFSTGRNQPVQQLTAILCGGLILDDLKSPSLEFPDTNRSLSPISVYGEGGGKLCITRDDNPYITHLRRMISDEGGIIQSPDSDVCVIIPPGAVEQRLGGLTFDVRVTICDDSFPLSNMLSASVSDSRQVQLSPVVDISFGSVECLSQPVVLKIPHRAYLFEDPPFTSAPNENHSSSWAPPVDLSSWRMRVLCSDPSNLDRTENSPRWHSVPYFEGDGKSNHPTCFSFDKDFVFVHTTRPVTLVATGCVHLRQIENTPRLKLSALTFGSYRPVTGNGRWQVSLRTYICDGFADARKVVCAIEEKLGGCRQSPDKDFLYDDGADIDVTLSQSCDASWTWKLGQNSKPTKNIPSSVINRGIPACLEFQCESTFPAEHHPPLLTSFSLSQGIGNDDKPAEICRIFVTDNFLSQM